MNQLKNIGDFSGTPVVTIWTPRVYAPNAGGLGYKYFFFNVGNIEPVKTMHLKRINDIIKSSRAQSFQGIVQSLSCIRLFATPWIAARQASLSVTNSRSLLKLTSIESVMPSSHLILSSPSPPAPNPSQNQGLYQWINSLHEVAKILEFQL